MSSDPQIHVIIDIYAMVSVMRIVSSSQTLASAEKIMVETPQAYFEPNITVRELHERVERGDGVDPMKESSEAARAGVISPRIDRFCRLT